VYIGNCYGRGLKTVLRSSDGGDEGVLKYLHNRDVIMTKHQGKAGEDLACRYLQQQGMMLIARNYRCRRGEIDLIMLHGDSLVFIEVRYRHRPNYGSAAESIDLRKQRKISGCALHYLQRHPAFARYPGRFDVVCIAPGDSGPKVEWISDAFTA